MSEHATTQPSIERKAFDPRWLVWVCFACAVLARVWWRLNPLKFNPVNGDFQTFNAASRVLQGQIPFVDFTPYLGLGPSYLTAAGMGILGGDFSASVIGAEILSACAFIVIAYTALARSQACRPLEWAVGLYLVTALAATVLYGASWLPFRILGGLLLSVLGMATTSLINPGHSLLVLRAVWPFLLVPVFVWIFRQPSAARACVFGGLLGAGTLWAPDYGATAAVGFLAAAVLSRKLGVGLTLLAVSMTLVGALGAIFAVTQGHPDAWLRFAAAVNEYQSWYYLDEVHKALSLGSLLADDIAFINLLLIALCLGSAAWLAIRLVRTRTEDLAAILAVLLATVLAGVLTSVRSAFVPYYMSTATTVVLCVGLAYVSRSNRPFFKRAGEIWPIGLVAAIVLIVAGALQIKPAEVEGGAQERLGVALHSGMSDFEHFVKYVSDRTDRPWSTYATGLEAAMGVHHPSGADYIIHALGSDTRGAYLALFTKGDFPVVVTPRLSAVEWEAWSRRANFDFYRLLLRRYEPTANFSHWTVWERRSDAPRIETGKCRIEQLSESQVAIRMRTGPASQLIDVELNYSSEWRDGARQEGGIARLVTVTDRDLQSRHETGVVVASYGQPNTGMGRHVPLVTDEHGNGEVVLSAHPRGLVTLRVADCEAKAIASAAAFTQ